MAYYDKNQVNIVREFPIINTVEHYLGQGKKSGTVIKYLCPFHKDKDPSLTINPVKNTFRCFSCQAGGGSIDFVMDYDKVDFTEAVKIVGNINSFEPKKDESFKKEMSENQPLILKLYEIAHKFYKKHFRESKAAQEFWLSRGFTKNQIKDYGLCYAPAGNKLLKSIEAGSNYTVEDWLATGLIQKSKTGNLYDHFQDRMVIPIRDDMGRLVAFAGRIYKEEHVQYSKYKNSHENSYYKKGEILLGLDRAKHYIKESGKVYIAEGDLDVIKSSTIIPHTVGVGGTSFTKYHADKLKSYGVKKAILMSDGDKAGWGAMFRMIPILLCAGIDDVWIVILPTGTDPDGLISSGEEGIEKFKNAAYNPIRYSTYLKRYIQRKDLNEEERIDLARELIFRINVPNNHILEEEIIRNLSHYLSMDLSKIKSISMAKASDNIVFRALMFGNKFQKALEYIRDHYPPTLGVGDAVIDQVYISMYKELHYKGYIEPAVFKMRYPFLTIATLDDNITSDVLIEEIRIFIKNRIGILIEKILDYNDYSDPQESMKSTLDIAKLTEFRKNL